MGKNKRSRDDSENLERLLKKVKKLNRKVEKLGKDKQACRKAIEKSDVVSDTVSVNSENVSPNIQQDENSVAADNGNSTDSDTSSKDELSDKDTRSETKSVDSQNQETVDDEFIRILGDDPTESQALKMTVKPELLKRWTFFCNEGMRKENFEEINKKYECIQELKAPKLNPQILSTMKESAVARDNHMVEIQQMTGSALSVVGSLISEIYDNKEEGVDLEKMLTSLCDVAKFLTSVMHKQSNSRKAFIEPGLSKETKAILKDTKIDEYLYGKELGEKIKEAKALEKMSKDLKVQQPVKGQLNNTPSTSNQFLNQRAPFARRPQNPQMGYTQSGGRQRPRLFFKNRQQYVNHRAQGPPRQKPAQTIAKRS